MNIIDWSNLNAPDVPGWLIGLMSTNEEKQLQSKFHLERFLRQHALALNIAASAFNKVLQTDAPVLVTELLVEMLATETPAKPMYIVELLGVVSSYQLEPSLKQVQRARALKIYEIVSKKFDLYLEMLEYPDADTRTAIINLLESITEKRLQVANALIHHIKANQIIDEIEILSAIDLIFDVVVSNDIDDDKLRLEFVVVLNAYVAHREIPKSILAHAACYLILLQGKQVSQSIIDMLMDILKITNFTNPSEDILLDNLWVKALLSTGIDRTTQSLLNILNYQSDVYMIIEVSAILLNLHFGDYDFQYLHILIWGIEEADIHAIVSFGQNQSSLIGSERQQKFSDLQKDILTKLIQKDLLWEIQTNLFELFGLPASRTKLKELV